MGGVRALGANLSSSRGRYIWDPGFKGGWTTWKRRRILTLCVCVCVDGEMRVLERLSGVCERRLIREVNEWVMDVQKWFLEWRTT